MSVSNRVAVLALIASDDSYRSSWQPGDPLQTFPDSRAVDGVSEPDPVPLQLILAAGITHSELGNGGFAIHGWNVAGSVTDSQTGFGAVVYQNSSNTEAIVAFTGTNGVSPQGLQGWWTDLTLARTQWNAQNSAAVFAAIAGLPGTGGPGSTFDGAIHFAGQSLGGALAQYALFDYADRLGNTFSGSRVTLTTYNALGVMDRLSKDPRFNQVSPRIHEVSTAHFATYNDVIHRLGGGLLNGASNTYQLKFTRTIPAYEYVDPEGTLHEFPAREVAYDVVDAHRIESGFYRGFAKTGWTFDNATRYTPDLIAAEASRSIADGFGNLLNDRDHFPAESVARLVSGIAASLAVDPAATAELARALLRTMTLQAETSSSEAFWRSAEIAVPLALQSANALPVARASLLAVATYALAAASAMDAGEDVVEAMGGMDEYVLEALLTIRLHSPDETADFELAESLVDESSAAKQTSKAAAALAFVSRTLPDIPADIGEVIYAELNAGLESFKSGDWAVSFLRHVTAAVAASKATSGATMEELGRAAGEALGSVASAIHALESKLAGPSAAAQATFQELVAEIDAGTIKVAQSFANALDELVSKYSNTFEWGATVSRQALASAIESLTARWRSNTGETGLELIPAIEALQFAAQLVVVGAGRSANPFDAPAFDPDTYSLPSASIAEAIVFAVYIPPQAPGPGHEWSTMSARVASSIRLAMNSP